MKTVGYISKGIYKSIKVDKSMTTNELYRFLLRLEGTTFCIRRIIYE